MPPSYHGSSSSRERDHRDRDREARGSSSRLDKSRRDRYNVPSGSASSSVASGYPEYRGAPSSYYPPVNGADMLAYRYGTSSAAMEGSWSRSEREYMEYRREYDRRPPPANS